VSALSAVASIAAGYGIGAIPVAYLAGRIAGGIDIREHGSGSAGASNVWQSVSRTLVVPVGLLQIAQGAGAVLLARALGHGEGVQALAGLAAVVAHDWNPLLGLRGGRGIGASIGVLGALSPLALVVFIGVALAGVVLRAIPQGVALALFAAPLGGVAAGDSAAAVSACVALAAVAMVKRLFANAPPDAGAERAAVYRNRLLYDRDIRDRDAWVRRNTDNAPDATAEL
jgi:glycerol-3-phosphate acyltransferase PlsY